METSFTYICYFHMNHLPSSVSLLKDRTQQDLWQFGGVCHIVCCLSLHVISKSPKGSSPCGSQALSCDVLDCPRGIFAHPVPWIPPDVVEAGLSTL